MAANDEQWIDATRENSAFQVELEVSSMRYRWRPPKPVILRFLNPNKKIALPVWRYGQPPDHPDEDVTA